MLFRVGCDAGTYIRTLAVDIGEALGVGANMEALRRTRSGTLVEDGSVTLQELKDACVAWKEDGDDSQLKAMIMPFELLLEPMPKIVIKDSAVDAICHGADLAAAGVIRLDPGVSKGATVALFTQKGEGVALGVTMMDSGSIFKAVEGNVVRSDRVFMRAGHVSEDVGQAAVLTHSYSSYSRKFSCPLWKCRKPISTTARLLFLSFSGLRAQGVPAGGRGGNGLDVRYHGIRGRRTTRPVQTCSLFRSSVSLLYDVPRKTGIY